MKWMVFIMVLSILFQHCLLYLFLFISKGTIISSSCVESNKILNGPHDITAYAGNNATFTCTVGDFNPEEDTVTWSLIPVSYKKHSTEYVDAHDHTMISTLTLFDIGRSDRFVICKVKTLRSNPMRSNDREYCYSSMRAKQIVQYFPENTEISCSPQGPISVQDGEHMPIK